MNEPVAEREALWDQFLQRWPLETLREMTLEQYSQAGTDDYFCRWLEKHTESLGSIWGGSSFKFGVFSRRDKQEKTSSHLAFSEHYAWQKKYGVTAEEAFAVVRGHIVSVAEAARRGDLESIEQVDLGPVVKWKIAFLYQDRQNPSILCVFAARDLCAALGRKASHNEKLTPLQRELMTQRQGANLFSFSDQLWKRAQDWHHQHSLAEQALEYFKDDAQRFQPINETQKMAGFRLGNGQELALLREGGQLSLFVAPGPWQQTVTVLGARVYSPDTSRHSGLSACAPSLALGHPAVAIKLADMAALEDLCQTYELDALSHVQEALAGQSSGQHADLELNQILFGPPGTGKTYATIDAALEIIEPSALLQERARRHARFRELVTQKRVRFVTFHQSFSYEDFVEGLRALPPGSEENPGAALSYDVAKGVFVQLCQDAVSDPVMGERLGLKDDPAIWKISIEEASSDGHTRRYCFEKGEARIGWSGTGDLNQANLSDPALKLGSNDRSSLDGFVRGVEPGDVLVCLGTRKSICAVGVVKGEYEYQPEVPQGVREDYVHRLPVNWLLTDIDFDITTLNGGVGLTLKTLYRMNRLSWPELKEALQQAGHALAGESPAAVREKLPYVLIIDEINRGNISRIFGELITLIEPSKRAGAEEALEVLLPYSKKPFSVPDNVYLIGTMNTADRSLAGLDIALRRRFTFREMPPRPDLLDGVTVDGVDVGELLRVMNQRIEVLLGRDYCLGHAYFMELQYVSDDEALARLALIFRQKVLPLLQEYFFEDWERIGWVLNDQSADSNGTQPFIRQPAAAEGKSLQALFGSKVAGGLSERRWELNDEAFASIDSYRNICRSAG